MENGVKNLKGARLFPEAFSNHRFGDVSFKKLEGFLLQQAWRVLPIQLM
jgi:hypothetical protein